MKALATFIILASLILVSACVPSSLNPLYTEQDLTFDNSLIGTWTDKETGDTWTLSSCAKANEYSLLNTDSDGGSGEFSVRLVKVEDELFLDLMPVKPGFTQNDFYKEHYFSTHTFVHIARKGQTIQIAYLEADWLKDYLADHPEAIRHEKVAGEVMLTSSPKQTQKFLLQHLKTGGAFSQPAELTRKRGAQ